MVCVGFGGVKSYLCIFSYYFGGEFGFSSRRRREDRVGFKFCLVEVGGEY